MDGLAIVCPSACFNALLAEGAAITLDDAVSDALLLADQIALHG